MNAQQVLDVISKGYTVIEALRQAFQTASPAIKATLELIEQYKSGAEVSPEELARIERVLDEQLDLFNQPLPED